MPKLIVLYPPPADSATFEPPLVLIAEDDKPVEGDRFTPLQPGERQFVVRTMSQQLLLGLFPLALWVAAAGSVSFAQRPAQSATPLDNAVSEIRPNPYFQPPGAKTGAPIDVSEVKGIAFAPHDQTSGRLAITQFVVLK